VFGAKLQEHFGGQEAALLAHPQYRLHVFTSHGRRWLRRETARWRTGLGYGAAFASNLVARSALGAWLERVVFSDPRDTLPLPLHDFRGQQVGLSPQNLIPAVLASCSIPFWLEAVHDIPGAPRGAYWDGGITDYHLHLRYDRLLAGDAGQGADPGWVLYPHFQPTLVPGWLDKAWRWRHRATARWTAWWCWPRPEWLATLPGGRLPSREDFKAYLDDDAAREPPGAVRWPRASAWPTSSRPGSRAGPRPSCSPCPEHRRSGSARGFGHRLRRCGDDGGFPVPAGRRHPGRRPLGHHDDRGVGVAADDAGHGRGVHHPQARQAVHLHLGVHHGQRVGAHAAAAHRVVDGVGVVADELGDGLRILRLRQRRRAPARPGPPSRAGPAGGASAARR
jgi:hypothetical protein